jgi:hypothetical protein
VSTIGTLLTAIGVIAVLVAHFWIVIIAFQESLAWGAGSLLVPVVVVVFVISHWGKVAKPFAIYAGGWLIMLLGAALSGRAYS